MKANEKINSRLCNLEKQIEEKMDEETHYILLDHFFGLASWTAFVIAILAILGTILIHSDVGSPKYYYQDPDMFCGHYGMTFQPDFGQSGFCHDFKNDTDTKHKIEKINDRWVFIE